MKRREQNTWDSTCRAKTICPSIPSSYLWPSGRFQTFENFQANYRPNPESSGSFLGSAGKPFGRFQTSGKSSGILEENPENLIVLTCRFLRTPVSTPSFSLKGTQIYHFSSKKPLRSIHSSNQNQILCRKDREDLDLQAHPNQIDFPLCVALVVCYSLMFMGTIGELGVFRGHASCGFETQTSV